MTVIIPQRGAVGVRIFPECVGPEIECCVDLQNYDLRLVIALTKWRVKTIVVNIRYIASSSSVYCIQPIDVRS